MQSVCHLRIYTDDDRLLTGRPRVYRASDVSNSLSSNYSSSPIQAMSTHTSSLSGLNPNIQHQKKQTKTQRSS